MTRRPAFFVAMCALLLVVCTSVLFAVLRQPPIWTLDIGARDDEQFIAGFFEIERGDGAEFRWSGPGAQLRLHGADVAPNVLQLRLHTDERAVQKRQGVQLSRDEQPFATFTLQPGWRVYHTLVQAGSGGATPAIGIEITKEMPPVRGRALGVALDQLRIVPLQPTVFAPLVRSLLLTWWVALLAALLWRILSLRFLEQRFANHWLPIARTLLVGASIVATTALLAHWAQRDPHSLARALPPMPWVQGLATLALIMVADKGQGTGIRHRFSVSGSRFLVLGPFGMLIVAQLLLTTQTAVTLGVALALMALAALVYAGGLGNETTLSRPDLTPRTTALALGAIVVVALGLRFHRLAELPFGLWRDEARHGLFAIQLLEDPNYRPVYLADNRIQLPALGLYPFALAVKLWGIHLWTMRPITALAGALTVLPLYGLAHWLWGRRDIALLAAAFLSVSSWHIIISRFSFPTVFDPLLTLTGLWLLTVRSASPSDEHAGERTWLVRLGTWFLAGICIGLALQTYHTGRLAPLAATLVAVLVLWRSGWQWRRWLIGGVVALVGFAIVATPLIMYALQHSSDFNARTGSVFLLGTEALHGQAPLTALEESVRRHVLMFNVHGDDNGRHANPGQPMLDFATGLGFLLGCAVLLRRWREPRSMITFALLGLGLLPSLLSVDSPHGMRSIDSAAYACLIAAIGWVCLATLMARQWPETAHSRSIYRFVAISIPVIALALNYRIYFVQMPTNPEVWQSYYPAHTQAGTYIRDLAAQSNQHMPQVFVRSNLATNPVFTYLTHDLPVQQLTAKTPANTVQPDALFVLSGYSYKHDIKQLALYVSPSAQPFAVGPLFPDGVTPSFVVYRRDQ